MGQASQLGERSEPPLCSLTPAGLDTRRELTLSAEDAEAVTGRARDDVWSSGRATVAGALCGGPCVALVLARVDAVATLRGCLSDAAAAATEEGLRASFGCVLWSWVPLMSLACRLTSLDWAARTTSSAAQGSSPTRRWCARGTARVRRRRSTHAPESATTSSVRWRLGQPCCCARLASPAELWCVVVDGGC